MIRSNDGSECRFRVIKKFGEQKKKRVYGYDDMKMMTIMFHFFKILCLGWWCFATQDVM